MDAKHFPVEQVWQDDYLRIEATVQLKVDYCPHCGKRIFDLTIDADTLVVEDAAVGCMEVLTGLREYTVPCGHELRAGDFVLSGVTSRAIKEVSQGRMVIR